MGRAIIKIKDKYFDWSSMTDAPVTFSLNVKQLRKYYKKYYGLIDYEHNFERSLNRVNTNGTSAIGYELDDIICNNRAGKKEVLLTVDEIYDIYKNNRTYKKYFRE